MFYLILDESTMACGQYFAMVFEKLFCVLFDVGSMCFGHGGCELVICLR